MYKPKDTKDIYDASLSVNSANLEKQLSAKEVPSEEIQRILSAVADQYRQRLQEIVRDCERDMMALERVPSPLKLFIDCLSKSGKSLSLSLSSRRLIQQYDMAWEDWM